MVLEEVRPFVDWGGKIWEVQVATGVLWLGDLDGLRVLEIGTRHGGMATYLAKRRAQVTALDVSDETFDAARTRAREHGVADRVSFETYSGRPEDLPTGFDVVFSKSTLVLMGDQAGLAAAIADSLVPGGRLLAIENARGPWPVHLVRAVRPWWWSPCRVSYFTRASVASLTSRFVVELERWTAVPPTVLIGARRR